jgi:hypothetical protein
MLVIRKLQGIDRVQMFLQGAIFGGTNITRGVNGLVGQTLTFGTPAGSCTFAAGADPNGVLRPLEIITQIMAVVALATLSVRLLDGKIVFIEKVPALGVALGGAVQPAKAILGFELDSTLAGTFYNPPGGGSPELVTMYSDPSGAHIIVTEEP